ncbi:PfkB family carbohydrate kinase [Nocardia sp. CA-084685]|uniref:PfkB family carbohydrate kinase n=1 Tax=Nocardia sp. CA-084685 TaxID=3239970 RepID=UPI003D96CD8A
MVQQDSRTIAIRNILTRLSKRSGLSADRLRTTEIDVAALLDLSVIRHRAQQEGLSAEEAVLPVVRDLARQLGPTNRLIADAELSLGLLREKPPAGIDLERLYAADLGERRVYLTEQWRSLHETYGADFVPPAPTVRSLRATPERRAFTELAGKLAAAAAYSTPNYRFTPEPKVLIALPDTLPRRGVVTVIGSALIDHIYRIGQIPSAGKSTPGSFEVHAGGKGLNRAVAAARLGLRARLVSAVGSDDAGKHILNYLRTENVDTELVKVVDGATTNVSAVMITSTGVSSKIGCEDDRIWQGAHTVSEPRFREVLAGSDAVVLTFEQPSDAIKGVLAAIGEMDRRPSLVVNPSPPINAPQYLYQHFGAIDYLVGSTWELRALLPGDAPASATEVAQRLRSLGVRGVCVIDGFRCIVRSDEITADIADFPVALEDAPGAAAAFSAALVSKIVATGRPADEPVFRWATAAMVATQSFGDIPDAMPSVRDIDRIVQLAGEESAGA